MGGRVGAAPGGNLGEQLNTQAGVTGEIANLSTGANNGPVIDRQGYNAAVARAMVGPGSSFTSAAFKVQHGAASDGSDMADLAAAVANSEQYGDVTTTISAVNTAAEMNIDLRRAKRYIRIVTTITGTSGYCACPLALGANVIDAPV